MEILLGIAAVVLPMIIRAVKNRLANKQPGQGGGVLDRLRNRRNPQPAVPPLQPVPQPVPVQPELPVVVVPRIPDLPGGTVGLDGFLEMLRDIIAVADHAREMAREKKDA